MGVLSVLGRSALLASSLLVIAAVVGHRVQVRGGVLAGPLDWRRGAVGGGQQQQQVEVEVAGRSFVVTGANTGIGLSTAALLWEEGAAVLLVCRSREKCERAREAIEEGRAIAAAAEGGGKKEQQQQQKKGELRVAEVDLSSWASIEAGAAEIRRELSSMPPLQAFINNAGAFNTKTQLAEGINSVMMANHYGPAKLTFDLLPEIKAAKARIVMVSSQLHDQGNITRADPLCLETNIDNLIEANQQYSDSKLANVLFAQELAKELKGTGVTVNSLHPGLVATDLLRDIGNIYRSLMSFIYAAVGMNPVEGAQTTLYVAANPSVSNVTGKYFSHCAERAVENPIADDAEFSEWFYKYTKQVVSEANAKLGKK